MTPDLHISNLDVHNSTLDLHTARPGYPILFVDMVLEITYHIFSVEWTFIDHPSMAKQQQNVVMQNFMSHQKCIGFYKNKNFSIKD